MGRLFPFVSLVFMLTGIISAADWHTWRGPDANSISKETGWNPAALKNGAKILWSADLGEGYSAVSVKDGKVYTMGNIEKNDIIYCLDVKTGKTVWTYTYPCDDGAYPGPRATPVIDGDKLYTLSRDGDLICLRTADGKKVWDKKVLTDFKAANIQWGLASSPVIRRNMVLINAGASGMAVDKNSGKLIWGQPGSGNYTTPVIFTAKGSEYAAIANKAGLNVITTKDGKVAAFFPWETAWDIIAADPLVSGNHILLSTGYGTGATLLKFDGSSLTPVWKNNSLEAHFSSPILMDGYVYASHGNAGKKKSDVRCIDLMKGEVRWQQQTGFTNLMAADGKLIFINETGTLTIAAAKPDAYQEFSSAQVLDEKNCWTMPVLANGIIYCRNSPGKLVAVDVRK